MISARRSGKSTIVEEFAKNEYTRRTAEKRVVFSRIAEGSTANQYEKTFFGLSDSMITNECRRVNDPNVGLSLNESNAKSSMVN